MSDSWEVRRIVEVIRRRSGADIVDFLVKPPCLGIIVTDPIFGKEPCIDFGGCAWFEVIELNQAEATKERLFKELAKHT
jgi:hypothetical protein